MMHDEIVKEFESIPASKQDEAFDELVKALDMIILIRRRKASRLFPIKSSQFSDRRESNN